MTLNDQQTYYDVLDLKPDASPQEIREAYFRIKATYNKDSVALYSLVGANEREEMLRLIEEAYDTLSHADRRKEYDRYHGLMDSREFVPPVRPPARKIISIDRVPPMEPGSPEEELLIAPSTDFGAAARSADAADTGSPFDIPAPTVPPPPPAAAAPPAPALPVPAPQPQPAAQPPAFPGAIQRASRASELASSLAREIEAETEWTGLFLKRVREMRNISIEELSAITKISKTYLQAVEEENYPKLPAPVYVRGFVNQMARALKLPQEKVSAAYMSRFSKNAPEK
ncbi:MAG: helix-turn-helix domain-containing protein [Oligoflexia bacterium]|nr:helix-turn-helix domain-containing protein [Oligoflexia bacterium]